MIRVLIVTDIRLYRDGLAQMLGREQQLSIACAAGDLEGAIASVRDLRPDIVLIDLAMAESLAVVRAIGVIEPNVKVVALATPQIEEELLACAEAGVAGFVAREAGVPDLITTLQSVGRGELLCSPRIAAALLGRVTKLAAGQAPVGEERRLTGRELETLHLVEQGLSNKDIARQLGIEVATVKNHVHSILAKLRVHRRGQAAARMRGALPRRVAGRHH